MEKLTQTVDVLTMTLTVEIALGENVDQEGAERTMDRVEYGFGRLAQAIGVLPDNKGVPIISTIRREMSRKVV